MADPKPKPEHVLSAAESMRRLALALQPQDQRSRIERIVSKAGFQAGRVAAKTYSWPVYFLQNAKDGFQKELD